MKREKIPSDPFLDSWTIFFKKKSRFAGNTLHYIYLVICMKKFVCNFACHTYIMKIDKYSGDIRKGL